MDEDQLEDQLDQQPVSREPETREVKLAEGERPVQFTSAFLNNSRSGMGLFVSRMHRQGEYAAFRKRVAYYRLEHGCQTGHAARQVAKEMGYRGQAEERRLYMDYLRKMNILNDDQSEQAAQESLREERQQAAFDRALAKLPNTSPPAVELEWIRSHPAMSRQVRSGTLVKETILLTVADIKDPPNGPAPSKSAVHSLQYWCNNRNDFYKSMLGEHKKKAAKEGSGEAIEDLDDVEETRELLKGSQRT